MQSINRLFEKSKNARRAFTVLELLVASLLLGMLMTILTMVFNQSSIAWRTGTAGVAAMGEVREKIADVRSKADNVYVWGSTPYYASSVFDKNGDPQKLNKYLLNASDAEAGTKHSNWVPTVPGNGAGADESQGTSGSFTFNDRDGDTYVVNVMSAGPDRVMDTYDDIWSFPDDPNEW